MSKLECIECQSTSITYLPDVDGNSWVNITYEQNENGVWKALLTGEKAVGINEELKDNLSDVSEISKRDIFYNDGNAFFYCKNCKIEFDSRSL